MSASNPGHIVVIGAGIIGLQTAITLLRASYRVTLIAEHLPGDFSDDYTSPWAGAHWRTHAEAGTSQSKWDLETYDAWVAEIKENLEERVEGGIGIELITSRLYWTHADPLSNDLVSSLWWAPHVSSFSTISTSSLAPEIHDGATFTSIVIDVPRRLRYLLSTIQDLGGAVVRARLPTQKGLLGALSAAKSLIAEDVDAFVNATGLGAKALVGDDGMYPIRGQTVLVKGAAATISLWKNDANGEITYVLPRKESGVTVLGGTNENEVWDTRVNKETTKKILERCEMFAPELLNRNGEFELLGVQVGRRPARKRGPRVEREVVGEGDVVVHAYGHAGAGYQNSVGCANEVLSLLSDRQKGGMSKL